MEQKILGLGILLPIFIFIMVCILVSLLVLIRKKEKNQSFNKKGFLFLEIDLNQWRIKRTTALWNDAIQNLENHPSIKNIIGYGWMEISDFFKKIGWEEEKKWKEAIEFCIQNNSNLKIQSSIVLNEKTQEKISWDVDFFDLKDNRLKVNIKWTNKKNINFSAMIINKENLIKDNYKYKLFVAFNLIKKDVELYQEFIYKINSLLNLKDVSFFISQNVIVAILKSNDFHNLEKQKQKIVNKLKKQSISSMIENYYNGLTYVDAMDIDNESKLIKVLARIWFGITKSKKTLKPFHFNVKNIFFNEFEEFKETINNVNQAIQSHDFSIEKIEVFSLKTEKKTFNYYMPKFNIMENQWTPFVLEFMNFKENSNKIFFNKMLNEDIKHSFLINVNDSDINEFFPKMQQNNKNIYIINFVSSKTSLDIINLLQLLQIHEIKFGIKVKDVSSPFLSIIENTKPSILILTEEYSKNFDNESLHNNLNKVNLVFTCERKSIALIFENGNEELRKSIINIGKSEKYYYLTK